WGDMARVKSEIDFQYNRLLNILFDVYEGFMTREEITHMVDNHQDINMGADEILSRLEKRKNYFDEKEEKEMAELEEILTIGQGGVNKPATKKAPAKKTARSKKQ